MAGVRVDRLPGWYAFPITCYTVDGVLTKEECEAWMAEMEGGGHPFEPAKINTGVGEVLAPETRNCSRLYVDNDKEKLGMLWDRIRPTFPTWDDEQYGKPQGLNPRLRVMRYEPGQYFKPHYDGNYDGIEGRVSYWTLQVYLNDAFEGGDTVFYKSSGVVGWEDTEEGVENLLKVRVRPKQGSVLIFDQELYHEGAEVTKGTKYIVRTDILFPEEGEEEGAGTPKVESATMNALYQLTLEE